MESAAKLEANFNILREQLSDQLQLVRDKSREESCLPGLLDLATLPCICASTLGCEEKFVGLFQQLLPILTDGLNVFFFDTDASLFTEIIVPFQNCFVGLVASTDKVV